MKRDSPQTQNPKTAVALIEDHKTVRQGIRAILNNSGRYQVAAEAGSAEEALTLLPRIKPEIILLDISLPEMNGLELLPLLQEKLPEAKVIALSMYNRLDYIEELIKEGICGYLTKQTDDRIMIMALDTVSAGEYFFEKSVLDKAFAKLLKSPSRFISSTFAGYESLTQREQEVFRYLAEGFSTKEIGYHLSISHRTIENYKSSLMRKLNLHTSVDLVRYAQNLGIVD